VAGFKAYPHMGRYVAAKRGVIGPMRSFAVELGQRMIRVNAVLPTHVNSPLLVNEATYRAFRPELENPAPDDLAPVCQSFHYLPIPWVTPKTSPTPCCSWPPTMRVTSPASRSRWMPAAA
jgi:NAD(P)-dependent dehydrogenase (short-subunit alcohol dehydrogenase family)